MGWPAWLESIPTAVTDLCLNHNNWHPPLIGLTHPHGTYAHTTRQNRQASGPRKQGAAATTTATVAPPPTLHRQNPLLLLLILLLATLIMAAIDEASAPPHVVVIGGGLAGLAGT